MNCRRSVGFSILSVVAEVCQLPSCFRRLGTLSAGDIA